MKCNSTHLLTALVLLTAGFHVPTNDSDLIVGRAVDGKGENYCEHD